VAAKAAPAAAVPVLAVPGGPALLPWLLGCPPGAKGTATPPAERRAPAALDGTLAGLLLG
jgi:hypothetical protein